jgi:hypothetical protein
MAMKLFFKKLKKRSGKGYRTSFLKAAKTHERVAGV